jgi:hypothetical protein
MVATKEALLPDTTNETKDRWVIAEAASMSPSGTASPSVVEALEEV